MIGGQRDKSDGGEDCDQTPGNHFERLVPLWVFSTRHTSRPRHGDLFVLSLCTVLKSSFSLLLYLMPCEKVSVIGKRIVVFFITLFFCIVTLKLINIQTEIVNFYQMQLGSDVQQYLLYDYK